MRARMWIRWGLMLDTLSDMADVEWQLSTQGRQPGTFVPDDLLDRWDRTFQGGSDLASSDISPEVLAILADFDVHLDEIIEALPESSDSKEEYIQHNEVWQIVRELADWTLTRIAILTMPEEAGFEPN